MISGRISVAGAAAPLDAAESGADVSVGFTFRFIQSVGTLTLANAVGAVALLVQGVLVARWLGPELYGVAALVLVYPSIVATFFSARPSDAAQRYIAMFRERGDRDRLLAMGKWSYTIDLATAVIAAAVVAATSRWAALTIIGNTDMAPLMTVYAVGLIAGALGGTSYSVLAVLDRFPMIALVETSFRVLRSVLVVALVAGGFGVEGVVWGNALGELFSGVAYAAVANGGLRRTFGASAFAGEYRALRGYRREVFGFLAYSDLTVLVGLVPRQLDLLLLGWFQSPIQVGYYKIAKSFASIAGYVVGPLQRVTYPKLIRLWEGGDRGALSRVLRDLQLKIGLPVSLLTLVGIVALPEVLKLTAGTAYLSAILPAQLMLLGAAIWLGLFWLPPLFLARGALSAWLRINIVVSVASLGLYALAASRGGFVGLAACSAVMAVSSNAIGLVWLWHHRERP